QQHRLASLLDRLSSCFQHSYHAQAGSSVIERSRIPGNALVEIRQLGFQSLDLFDLRSPHISRAIADQQLMQILAILDADSFVVNFDFFVRIKIVPHEHFLLATDEGRADFYRRQPIYVHMRNDVPREIKGDERHVLMAVEMAFTGCNDSFWIVLDDVIHDGKIVGRQVPDDIDIVLEQAKVHAKGVVVVQISKGPVINELPDLPHSTGEQKSMVHHNLQAFALSQLNQFLRLPRIASERLFHEYVLTVVKRRLGQLVVCPDRSDYGDHIYFRRLKYV